MNILGMGREDLLTLCVDDISRSLTAEEVLYMATVFGAFWAYNYDVAKQKPGLHAILKSGLHSDGFFVSRIFLEPENIRRIIARQIVMRLRQVGVSMPDYVAGIPDGATALGKVVAEMLGVPEMPMEKVEGRIVVVTKIPDKARLLLVEDFCTRGTGFVEAVLQIRNRQPSVSIAPYNPVIINRGGLTEIVIPGHDSYMILSVVERRIQDWESVDCPLCALGSKPIKPKVTDENWQLITKSQL